MAENRDTCLARQLDRLGIKHPSWTITLARKHKLDLSLCASILLQESGGGRNVFGHDPYLRPTRFLNWLKGRKVTASRYRAYRRYRKRGHGMQGVGPLQLTWYEIQNEADRKGGAWRPFINMDVGFAFLAEKVRAADNMFEGVARYNGTGSAANDYARRVMARRQTIHDHLAHCN